MSAYEQHIEPPDRKWQYLLFAAEPYETISFKLPSREIDKVVFQFIADSDLISVGGKILDPLDTRDKTVFHSISLQN